MLGNVATSSPEFLEVVEDDHSDTLKECLELVIEARGVGGRRQLEVNCPNCGGFFPQGVSKQ